MGRDEERDYVMAYRVEINDKLKKRLKQIPQKDKLRIIERLDQLAENPRPEDCKKLKGNHNSSKYRIRSGKYRIVYMIQDNVLIVVIVDIDHRKDIYQNLKNS